MNLTADQVLALQIGERVDICGEGPDGPRRVACTVGCRGGRKILTYRGKGQIKSFAIRDYPGNTYSRADEIPLRAGEEREQNPDGTGAATPDDQ